MAARNRKTRLATLEKTYSSPATLPDLQAPGQKSRSKDSMSEIAFHEKAGRSQVGSFAFFVGHDVFSSPRRR
jgi:hypothetical protein